MSIEPELHDAFTRMWAEQPNRLKAYHGYISGAALIRKTKLPFDKEATYFIHVDDQHCELQCMGPA